MFYTLAEGIRRQDVADLAMGALTKGLAPISIFSNLLNAYATLDNKHDITGKGSYINYVTQFWPNIDPFPLDVLQPSFLVAQIPHYNYCVKKFDEQPFKNSNMYLM